MTHEPRYWLKAPDAPFAALLSIVYAHCHPEASGDSYDDLKELVRDPQPHEKIVKFKEQLIAAIRDPSQVPDGALFLAGKYDDGSEEKFLHRLWRDLYPEESLPVKQ